MQLDRRILMRLKHFRTVDWNYGSHSNIIYRIDVNCFDSPKCVLIIGPRVKLHMLLFFAFFFLI